MRALNVNRRGIMLQNPQPIDPRWAWQSYRPSAASPWDLKKAGHLYRRATFGASWEELQTALRDGPERTITSLLQGRADPQADELWATMSRSLEGGNTGPDGGANGGLVAPLWLYRMLYSTHPLREKLTLFWHNHFATS